MRLLSIGKLFTHISPSAFALLEQLIFLYRDRRERSISYFNLFIICAIKYARVSALQSYATGAGMILVRYARRASCNNGALFSIGLGSNV